MKIAPHHFPGFGLPSGTAPEEWTKLLLIRDKSSLTDGRFLRLLALAERDLAAVD
jgi:hypothetical protein